jgi:hypothetical protein
VKHQAQVHNWFLLKEKATQYHSVANDCNQLNAASMNLDEGYLFAITEEAAAKLKF